MQYASIVPESIEELTAEYKRLWPLLPSLHAAIARLADKEAIKTCAKRLGMLSRQGGRQGIVFDHELEAEIFQDYLLYMYRPRGFSLVQQVYNRKRYPPGSDEQMLLQGMAQARFSAFWIREVHPAGGFVALDVVRGEHFFILDQAVANQNVEGMFAAFRMFPFRGAWMHTGANMTFGAIAADAGLQPVGRILSEQEERELNEENIRRWRILLREME